MARQIVIGLGNRFVHDDAAGLAVAEALRGKLPMSVEIREYEEMDLSLIEEFRDASKLVIVDSMKSGTKPGTVSLFTVAEGTGEGERFPSLHELELAGMIDLARRMGILVCPVVIVGIEPADLSLGEGLSPPVFAAVPEAVGVVKKQFEVAGQEAAEMTPGPRQVVILVNQSRAMERELGRYGISMAEGVADVLNLYLQKVTQKRDEDRREGGSEFDSANFGILVVGYGALGPSAERIVLIDEKRTWADERMTKVQSGTVSSDKELSTFSTWIDTAAGSAEAPLPKAIEAAADFLEPWTRAHRLAPPPYVINITDGTFDGDPARAAELLKAASTLNGRPVMWTCQLTDAAGKEPVLFPNEENLVPEGPARALFRVTSELPQECIRNLLMEFPEISKVTGARAAIFDADLRTLVRFVSFVTRVPLP